MKALLEASQAAVVAVDSAGAVRLWNGVAERMLGWTEADAVATPLATTVGQQAAALLAEVQGSGAATAGVPVEALPRGGARNIPLSASCAPVRAADGSVTGAVMVLYDVTASRDIERRFLDAQRLEVIDRIAGAIAHDLKNVLSAIKGFAIVAGEGFGEDDPARADMDQILKAAERGAALAQKLMAFSRNPVIQPSVVDLNLALQTMEKTIRRLVGSRLELVVRHAPALPLIKADAAQLEQVIVNLVLNARDAMPAAGRLVIETAVADLDEATARGFGVAPGRYARLTVTDTGDGMAPETRARMFEPFFTTKEPDRALGLGLPATLNIVRQLGGHIASHTVPGEGTTFTVDIPATTERAVQGPAPPPAAGEQQGAGTVLVVEDDDLVRMLTLKVLQRRGYTVLEAANADEAVERAEAHPGRIDLLLSDVGLPQINGPELAARLTKPRPDMKVLFMSGYGHRALIDRGLTPGPGVLEKPFSPDALVDRIRQVLAARQNS